MLIASQHAQAFVEGRVADPIPSFVAGFNTWKALGRSVDKGQHGYAVLAPVTGHRRTAAGEDGHVRPLGPKEVPQAGETEERRKALYGFKVEHVFEVGQTSGRPVPDVPRPKLLVGEAPEGLGAAVMALIESRGFTVDTVPDAGAINGANGQTNWGSKSVVVRSRHGWAAPPGRSSRRARLPTIPAARCPAPRSRPHARPGSTRPLPPTRSKPGWGCDPKLPCPEVPTPEEIALAYDALVETLWMIWDQAAAGGPNFADQVAHALGEVAGRPEDTLQPTPSDAGTRPQPQTPLPTGVSVDGLPEGRA